ncbi:GIY-YIG nuclease family protein [Thalassobaculum salexigens]|uniref:GIY-YIG nuclease family protein n=1 Tax=Thalassobaculum salexigens TaxID=455360 RepID=UPI00248E22D9|nr:GIY-YIG nuclease family protein [Thalassobaculum salexigens]
MAFFVYILASGRNGTLYVGRTSDLSRRMIEHRTRAFDGFTAQHGVTRLVHFERFEALDPAWRRERSLKRWRRDWKLNLIERDNPEWCDLALGISGEQ